MTSSRSLGHLPCVLPLLIDPHFKLKMAVKMSYFFCLALSFIHLVFSSTLTDEEFNSTTTTLSQQKSDDILADEIIQQLRSQVNISQIEPLPVGDVSFFTGGEFRGLSHIRRQGHTRRGKNDTLIIPAVLDNTQTFFNWTFPLLITRASGLATIRASQIPVILHVRTGHERQAQLDICDVPHVKGLTVQISGAGNLNFVTSRVAAIALGLTRSSLTRRIQDPLCAFVAGVL